MKHYHYHCFIGLEIDDLETPSSYLEKVEFFLIAFPAAEYTVTEPKPYYFFVEIKYKIYSARVRDHFAKSIMYFAMHYGFSFKEKVFEATPNN